MARKKKLDALITRQRILDESLNGFAKKGVFSTSLCDIAKAADVTRGAIYWHFTNKEYIIEEIFFQFEMAKSDHISPFYSTLRKNPISSLRDALVKTLYVISNNEKQAKVMSIVYCNREVLQCNTTAGYIRKNIFFNEGDVGIALEQGIYHGVLPPSFNVQKHTIIIISFMAGMIERWLLDPAGFDLAADGGIAISGYINSLISNATEHSVKSIPDEVTPEEI